MHSLGFMLNVFNDRGNITKYAERINHIAAILSSMPMPTCVILPAEKIFKAFLTFMSCSVNTSVLLFNFFRTMPLPCRKEEEYISQIYHNRGSLFYVNLCNYFVIIQK